MPCVRWACVFEMSAGPTIAERLDRVRHDLAAAEAAAKRRPGSVALVLVSKNVPVTDIVEAYEAGQRDFAENYVQSAREKMRHLESHRIRWHMTGQLQSNKAVWAARNFELLHSLATRSSARAISKAMASSGDICRALLQVRLGGGAGRGGVGIAEAERLASEVAGFGNIRLDGVMGVAPEGEEARPHFARLREVLERLRAMGLPGAPLTEMSAGMSADFPAAIMEGATLVRIGRAVFGSGPDKERIDV